MVRILHAISSLDPSRGGPGEVIRQSQPILERMGHRCEVVCLDRPDAPWLKDLPMPAYALGPGSTRYAFAPRLAPWLRAHAADYDCVLVHGLWRYIGYAVWRAVRATDTPYFLYTHGMLDPIFRQIFPWKHWQKRLHWALIEHRVARDARAVLFTCQEEARKAALAFRPYRVTPAIAPCCVATPPPPCGGVMDEFCRRWPEVRGKRVLLFLGRLHRKKGCDLLIESFGRFAQTAPELHLIMAGPEEEREWVAGLKVRAEELGVASRITWTGPLSGDLKWSAFRLAEAFILPSHQENFGIAVVEALACGTPVLVSKGVDIWTEILEEKAGLVDEVGAAGMANLLERWLSNSAEEQNAMKRNALQCYASRFQPEAAAARLIDVLSRGEHGTRAHGRIIECPHG